MRTRVLLTIAIAALLASLQIAGTRAAAQAAAQAATTSHELTFAIPGRTNAFPSIASDGRFIAVVWGATTTDGKADVFIVTSRNGGLTFGAPVQVNATGGEARLSGEMPPRVGIHTTASYGGPDVIVLWTARGANTEIKMARSDNGGRAFEEPVVLQSTNAAGDRGWPALTLDDKGDPHAIWLDHRGMAGEKHEHDPNTPRDPVASAQKSALYYANGAGNEHELTKGVCYCCKTSLIAGPAGTLFAAWRHVYPGSQRDIAFSASRDGGKNFSDPVPNSKDGWAIDACPDDGPAMALDATGQTVHIVWPTVVDATSNDPRGVLFYTSTRDGGRTFAARTPVPTLGSAKASHPQIARDASGRLFLAWDESIKGKRVAAVREIKPGDKVAFGPIVTITGDAAGQYPVLAATSDNLIAAWTASGEGIKVARVTVGSGSK